MSGYAMMSVRCLSNFSTRRWVLILSNTACVFFRRPVATRWRWNTTVICIAVTIMWNRILLGNIQETHMIELVASEQQRQFGRHKLDSLPQYCRACEVRFACHGGCPRNRFIETPDGEAGLNYLCAGYKLFSITSIGRCRSWLTCCARAAMRMK